MQARPFLQDWDQAWTDVDSKCFHVLELSFLCDTALDQIEAFVINLTV